MKLTVRLVFFLALTAVPVVGGIIPQPTSYVAGEGEFILTADTQLKYNAAAEGAKEAAEFFSEAIQPAMGFSLKVSEGSGVENGIFLTCSAEGKPFPKEGYAVKVRPNQIEIQASDASGYFYAIQTLRQMLPVEVFSETVQDVKWKIPAAEIEDAPKFEWRGLMLDVSRTYYTNEQLFRFVDLLALHKYNILHYHVTDDQNWRLQIDKYPDLIKYGAVWMGPPPRPGNPDYKAGEKFKMEPQEGLYYTKDDVRKLLAYAKKRHIMVVPEIELPGHAFAALTAYPEFSCLGDKLFENKKRLPPWECGIYEDVFCVGNDKTIKFLEDVLDEVCDLFDSPYIHIGGDECPKKRWDKCPKCQARIKEHGLKDSHQLQRWVTDHFTEYLAKKGRRAIGWDEILTDGLNKKAIIMSWRGPDAGIKAAKMGYDVIMASKTHGYFNYVQFPEKMGDIYEYKRPKLITTETVYSLDPYAKIPHTNHKHIIGAQACFWANWSRGEAYLDWKVFPRACVMSEVLWTYPDPKKRDFTEFDSRLTEHKKRLDLMGVNYADAKKIPKKEKTK